MSDAGHVFARDPRCHMLAVVLMAGYALRGMNHLRRAIPGGLNAAHILLHVLLGNRTRRTTDRSPRQAGAAGEGTHSILAISAAVGIPRETVRRTLVTLTDAGWLEHTSVGGYLPSAKARHWFGLQDVTGIAEFVWIAGQVKATLTVVGPGIEVMLARHPWHVALATQRESLPHPPYAEAIAPLEARLRSADTMHRERVAHVVQSYLYRHLGRLRCTYDGDLLLPVLIGEIAHRNISVLAHRADPTTELERIGARFADAALRDSIALAPINAHSLALAMDIPDATVRRKVAYLCRRGWIDATPGGTLTVGSTVREHAAALNDETLADMMACHRLLSTMGIAS